LLVRIQFTEGDPANDSLMCFWLNPLRTEAIKMHDRIRLFIVYRLICSVKNKLFN
jgi:hypothetical protein